MKNVLQYIDWELIDYNKANQKQTELFQRNIDRKQKKLSTENYLVFCEHPHVYTLGKSGKEENLLLNMMQLRAKNASFVHTNRGGDITYHGPGQLVGYPIFDLENFNIGLKTYIYTVEDCIINLLSHFQIEATRLENAAGVWLDAHTPYCRKICAIGVRSSRFVTMHGFALNVNTDLNYFNYINPCGFVDKGVTSIEKELGKKMNLEEIKLLLKGEFEKRFK